MADANRPPAPLPNDWNEAFAALPLEQAPPHVWSQLAAQLPHATTQRRSDATAIRHRHRSTARVAMAAVASLALALPLAWWLGVSPPSAVPTTPSATVAMSTALPATVVAPVDPDIGATGPTPADSAAASVTASIPAKARDAIPTGGDTREPRRHPVALVPARDEASSDAAIDTTAADQPQTGTAEIAAAPADDGGSRLDALREQSARLEALVAYARDERMTSAAAAVMSASLDDRIRLIDAALMQPALGDDMRSSLWDQRVGALQELAALEGTQRWMAVHGASMDAVARVD